jgi:hypothetical protein
MTTQTLDPRPTDDTTGTTGTGGTVAGTTAIDTDHLATTAEAEPATTSTGFSVAALVLSIVSIPTGFAALAVAGIVFGFIARRQEPAGRTMANWGIGLGIAALVGGFVLAAIGLGIALPFLAWGAILGA